MKQLIACLFAAALITSCATAPSSPKPHKSKYAFQCLQVSLPDSVFQNLTFSVDDAVSPLKNDSIPTVSNLLREQQSNSAAEPAMPQLTQEQVEEILKHSETTTVTFPVVYAGLGESATNDQTETVEMTTDADIVEGKVVYKKEPIKVGMMVSVEVLEAEDNRVCYKLNIMNKDLIGYDTHQPEEGLEVRMPFFEARSIDTKITQAPDSWRYVGGTINQQGTEPKIHTMLLFRVIAPTT